MMARVEKVRQVPLRVSDAGDRIIESGPLFDLLERPNDFQDWTQYASLLESYLSLYDCAFVAKVFGGSKLPAGLLPLCPQYVKTIWVVAQEAGVRVPAGWEYREPQSAVTTRFLWEDVIPIIGVNPHAPFTGLSPLKPGNRSILQDTATREQNLALFLNGGAPDILVSTDQSMTREQADEFLDLWMDRYSGYANAHRPGVGWSGLKVQQIGLNPAELQSAESLSYTMRDIVIVMRVMPAMLGVMIGETGLSQGSSTEEQIVAWWNQTGLGELARIASAHQQFLVDGHAWRGGNGRAASFRERHARRAFGPVARGEVPNGAGLSLWFDINQIQELVEHRLKRFETFDKAATRGYAPDDLNEYFDLGLPPHPTNVGTLPFSVQSVQDVGASPEATPAQGEEEPRTNTDQHRLTSALERLGEALERAPSAKSQAENFQKFLKPREKAAAKKWGRFYLEQRKRVNDRLKELGARAHRAPEEPIPANAVEAVFPRADEDRLLVARLTPLWTDLLQDGWNRLGEQTGMEVPDFSIDDPRTKAALESWQVNGTKVNDTTEEALGEILTKSIEEGQTLGEFADAIDSYYDQHAKGEKSHRAQTAARTQTAGVVNKGELIAAREVGGLVKYWIHGSPEEPREEHVAAAQAYGPDNAIGLDEKFVVGGVTMDHPLDPEAPVSAVANCTCTLGFKAA